MKKYLIFFSLLFTICFFLIPFVARAQNVASVIIKKLALYSTHSLKDPFYPDYPQRRIFFPSTNLSWWGTPGLNKYTITSKDPRVGNKSVTFYSSGYAKCSGGLEMGLPFGNTPDSSYNHITCSLSASDDFNFLFPFKSITTQQSTLDSPANITSNGGLNATIYLPLSWWNN